MNGRAAAPMAAMLKALETGFARHWPTAVLFALFMAMVSAFGTDRIGLVPRAAYWILLVAFAFLLRRALDHARPGLRSAPASIQAHLIPAAILSLAMLPIVWGVNALVLHSPLTAAELAKLALPVATVSVALELLMALERKEAPAPNADRSGPGFMGLADFLPLPLRSSAIEVLEAEDHYVRVHTAKGAALVRMRFSDAVRRMGDVPGLRSHRSWWVSRDSICDIRREEGRAYFILSCGKEVPISRAVARELGPDALSAVVESRR